MILDPFWCYFLMLGVILLVALSFSLIQCADQCGGAGAGGGGRRAAMTTESKNSAKKSKKQESSQKEQQKKQQNGGHDDKQVPPKQPTVGAANNSAATAATAATTVQAGKVKPKTMPTAQVDSKQTKLQAVASKQHPATSATAHSPDNGNRIGTSLSNMYKATVESVTRLFGGGGSTKGSGKPKDPKAVTGSDKMTGLKAVKSTTADGLKTKKASPLKRLSSTKLHATTSKTKTTVKSTQSSKKAPTLKKLPSKAAIRSTSKTVDSLRIGAGGKSSSSGSTTSALASGVQSSNKGLRTQSKSWSKGSHVKQYQTEKFEAGVSVIPDFDEPK